jgi:hypothetical protein
LYKSFSNKNELEKNKLTLLSEIDKKTKNENIIIPGLTKFSYYLNEACILATNNKLTFKESEFICNYFNKRILKLDTLARVQYIKSKENQIKIILKYMYHSRNYTLAFNFHFTIINCLLNHKEITKNISIEKEALTYSEFLQYINYIYEYEILDHFANYYILVNKQELENVFKKNILELNAIRLIIKVYKNDFDLCLIYIKIMNILKSNNSHKL